MNSCTFIGRVGRDAETRSTPKGDQVTNWTVAVDVGFGDKKTTLWVDCTMWGDRGSKIAGYIRKGDNIGISGEISLRTWEKDGKHGAAVGLRVVDVKLLSNKDDAASSKPKAAEKSGAGAPGPLGGNHFDDEEIPFARKPDLDGM